MRLILKNGRDKFDIFMEAYRKEWAKEHPSSNWRPAELGKKIGLILALVGVFYLLINLVVRY